MGGSRQRVVRALVHPCVQDQRGCYANGRGTLLAEALLAEQRAHGFLQHDSTDGKGVAATLL